MQRIVEDCRHTVGVFKVPLTPVRKPFWIKGPMRPFENRKLPNLTARIFWNNLPMVLACYAMSLSSGHLPLKNDLLPQSGIECIGHAPAVVVIH